MAPEAALKQVVQGVATAAALQQQAVSQSYLQAQGRVLAELQGWVQRLPPNWGVTLMNITPDLLIGVRVWRLDPQAAWRLRAVIAHHDGAHAHSSIGTGQCSICCRHPHAIVRGGRHTGRPMLPMAN